MKRIFIVGVILFLAIGFVLPAKAITEPERQSLISQILDKINYLKDQLFNISESQTAAVSSYCSDTDSGKDYSIKGAVTYAGRNYADYCYTPNPMWLGEYYCDGSMKFEWKYCANGCQDGICKTAISQPQANSGTTCVDSDNGKNYDVKGSLNYAGSTFLDFCVTSNSLYEYFCTTSATGGYNSEVKTCANGCQDGACKTATVCTPSWQTGVWSACTNGQQTRTVTDSNNCGVQTDKPAESQTCTTNVCTDSDNGKNYNTKGTVNNNGINYIDSCNGLWLSEYYCDDSSARVDYKYCDSGCNNGACITNTACSDTDNGKDYFTKGYLSYAGNTLADSCSNNDYLAEYYCTTPSAGGYATEYKKCNFGCQDGACKKGVTFTSPITTENQKLEPGKTYDITWQSDGLDGKNVVIYLVKNSSPKSWQIITIFYPVAGSSNYVKWTIPSSIQTVNDTYQIAIALLSDASSSNAVFYYSKEFQIWVKQTCTSSGNENDLFTKGTITYNDPTTGQVTTKTDSCLNQNYITKYFCDSGYNYNSIEKYCENGCFDGACKKIVSSCTESWTCTDWQFCSSGKQTRICTDSKKCGTTINKPAESQICGGTVCYDTDNGKNYSVKGTVYIGGISQTDYCYAYNPLWLGEYYCDGSSKLEWKYCAKGCFNGACRP